VAKLVPSDVVQVRDSKPWAAAVLDVPMADRIVPTDDDTALTDGVAVGTELAIPINHFEGNYTCDATTLARLRDEGRVVLRYLDNPNGSVDDIAGVCNAGRNVVGLMPHPERASDPLLGSEDGIVLLGALLRSAGVATPAA